jgi:hypothetical protein
MLRLSKQILNQSSSDIIFNETTPMAGVSPSTHNSNGSTSRIDCILPKKCSGLHDPNVVKSLMDTNGPV